MRIESKGGFQLINFSVIIVLVGAIVLDIALHMTTSGQAAGLITGQHVVATTGNGYYYLVNQNSGEDADMSGVSTANGAAVLQWPSTGEPISNAAWCRSLKQQEDASSIREVFSDEHLKRTHFREGR